MSRSWWPFKRRSDSSKKSKPSGEQGERKRLSETRRIARHVAREAYRAGEEPEPVIEPESKRPEGPTVKVYGDIIHVNFHRADKLTEDTFVKKDPVTRKLKRVARRFDRSDVFYTKDGRLIDDDNRPGR